MNSDGEKEEVQRYFLGLPVGEIREDLNRTKDGKIKQLSVKMKDGTIAHVCLD